MLKHTGCSTPLERNPILPHTRSGFKMVLQHTLQSPAVLQPHSSILDGVRAPVCSAPCQDRTRTLGLWNPLELKAQTTHTAAGMTKVSVHTIHLGQSIKCIQGLPNNIYTQNRALILETLSLVYEKCRTSGILCEKRSIMTLKTGNNRNRI